MTGPHFTRRELVTGAGAVILASQLSPTPARAAAKYTRYNVTSPKARRRSRATPKASRRC